MKNLLTILILLLGINTLPAQFTINQALSAPFPSNLTAAPTKEKIVWVANKEGVRNIWMAKGKDGTGKAVTMYDKDDGQAISNLIFKESTDELIFVRGGAPNRRGEIPNPTSHPDGAKRYIFKISENGGQIDTLAEGSSPSLAPDESALAFIKGGQAWLYDFQTKKAQPAFKIRGSAGSLTWAPDAKSIAFTSRRGDHSYVGIYELDANELTYLSPSVDNDSNPVWSPDGTAIAFIRIPTEKGRLPFYPRRSAIPWSILVHHFKQGKTMEVWKAAKGQGSAFRNISAKNQLFWTADNQIIFPYEGDGWTHTSDDRPS